MNPSGKRIIQGGEVSDEIGKPDEYGFVLVEYLRLPVYKDGQNNLDGDAVTKAAPCGHWVHKTYARAADGDRLAARITEVTYEVDESVKGKEVKKVYTDEETKRSYEEMIKAQREWNRTHNSDYFKFVDVVK